MNLFIVMYGNPIDGLAFTGPFEDDESALSWAENQNFDCEWWIVTLDKPSNIYISIATIAD